MPLFCTGYWRICWRGTGRAIRPLLLAEIYARLAKPDEMFYWLDAALSERSSRLCELRTNLWFQRYRSTGQFRSIEKRIGY